MLHQHKTTGITKRTNESIGSIWRIFKTKRSLLRIASGVWVLLFTIATINYSNALVFALMTPAQQKAFQEGIRRFNTEVDNCTGQSGSSNTVTLTEGGLITTLEGRDTSEKIMNYFVKGRGLKDYVAAAIVGNLSQESSLNPEIGGGGLAQWINERWTSLSNYSQRNFGRAPQTGNIDNDLISQLNFLWHELTTGYKDVLRNLQTSTNIADAVHQFVGPNDTRGNPVPATYNSNRSGGFENPGRPEEPNRLRRAQDALRLYSGSPNGSGGTATTTGATSCQGTAASNGACTVTEPVYDGQYSQAQLTQIFGPPGNASALRLVTVKFLGKDVRISPIVAPCLQAVSAQLEAEHVNYRVRSIADFRETDAQVGFRSYHCYGAAIDINPDTNPYSVGGAERPHDMPPQFVDAFAAHGFTWGGNWHSIKDYMHFEWHGVMPR